MHSKEITTGIFLAIFLKFIKVDLGLNAQPFNFEIVKLFTIEN